MNLKTISITKNIKNDFDEWRGESSTNKALAKLLDESELEGCGETDGERVNIHISDDIYGRLVSCRIYRDEPFSSVIYRLLSNHSNK